MAAPTSLTLSTDSEEYSRFEQDSDTVVATIVPVVTAGAGQQITVELVVARRSREQVKATKVITLVDDNPISVSFNIAEIFDTELNPIIRRGYYFIRATSISNPAATNVSPDFRVSLITTALFRKKYLHGADLASTNLAFVKDQPVTVTGVTVTGVSPTHSVGYHTLAYNISGSVRTLSWCNGPAVSITSSKSRYTLRKGSSNDYIDVKVLFTSLPAASISEEILIERSKISDSNIQTIIDQAVSRLEDSELHIFLEPTVIVTEIDTDGIEAVAGTDIPSFNELVDHDKIVDAITYFYPAAGHWVNFKFPYYPLLRVYVLYGKIGPNPIITIDPSWVAFHERGGFFELVPFAQGNVYNFITLSQIGSLRGPIPIPNFWNFKALVGFRETPAVILEVLGKMAAIDVLTLIGQSLRPGIGSTSVSKDGVSESISYLNTQQFGPFTGIINTYQKHLDEQLKKIRDSFLGPVLTVV